MGEGLGVDCACSRMSRRMYRLYSASSLKRPQRDLSAGMGLFFIQLPQAYWKKSTHGSMVLSIAVRSKLDIGLGVSDCVGLGVAFWAMELMAKNSRRRELRARMRILPRKRELTSRSNIAQGLKPRSLREACGTAEVRENPAVPEGTRDISHSTQHSACGSVVG